MILDCFGPLPSTVTLILLTDSNPFAQSSPQLCHGREQPIASKSLNKTKKAHPQKGFEYCMGVKNSFNMCMALSSPPSLIINQLLTYSHLILSYLNLLFQENANYASYLINFNYNIK